MFSELMQEFPEKICDVELNSQKGALFEIG